MWVGESQRRLCNRGHAAAEAAYRSGHGGSKWWCLRLGAEVRLLVYEGDSAVARVRPGVDGNDPDGGSGGKARQLERAEGAVR